MNRIRLSPVVENVGVEPLLLLPRQACSRYTTFSMCALKRALKIQRVQFFGGNAKRIFQLAHHTARH